MGTRGLRTGLVKVGLGWLHLGHAWPGLAECWSSSMLVELHTGWVACLAARLSHAWVAWVHWPVCLARTISNENGGGDSRASLRRVIGSDGQLEGSD